MLSFLSFSTKFIYKERKCGTVKKIKSAKNVIKQVSYERLSSKSIVYNS